MISIPAREAARIARDSEPKKKRKKGQKKRQRGVAGGKDLRSGKAINRDKGAVKGAR